MEEHKSVIMHLLSQVRLGMDLTKVRAKSSFHPSPRGRLGVCAHKVGVIQGVFCFLLFNVHGDE